MHGYVNKRSKPKFFFLQKHIPLYELFSCSVSSLRMSLIFEISSEFQKFVYLHISDKLVKTTRIAKLMLQNMLQNYILNK